MQKSPSITRSLLSLLAAILVAVLLLVGCASLQPVDPGSLKISIRVDGKQQTLAAPAGSTVQAVLDQAGVTLSTLDQVDPPAFTLLTQATEIRVVRVTEEFVVREMVTPFKQQTVKNESLPQGETRLIQPGINGRQQVTNRKVYEDGRLTADVVFKTITLEEAQPEIIMIGVQAPFSSTIIPGRLVYLTAGNAWLMEENTGRRRPVVTTGDLDGQVFTLSPDGSWLLFTRKALEGADLTINTLWAAPVGEENPGLVDLKVNNVVHFADWIPGTILTVSYSTVEPRSAPPGWQANNDLHTVSFAANGAILREEEIMEANSGGIYGWWGSTFAWSPDGSYLAYARPDSIGLVDLEKGQMAPFLEILPLQTRSDWAWVPGVSWSPDQKTLYTIDHAIMAGMKTPEESPLFDLTALVLDGGLKISLVGKTGMFAYPIVSPMQADGSYQVAYLQALFPEQSETSNYRLVLMDRDGSNRREVFPVEGSPGMEPQEIVWSPDGFENGVGIGLIYQGNLWFLNPETGNIMQVTGDGSISRIDWK